jgi:hypothetical protein
MATATEAQVSYLCIGSESEHVRQCQRGPRGNTTVKGHRRTDLTDVWHRYLPAEAADSGTSITSATTEDDTAPHVPNVTDVSEMRGEGGDLDDNPFGDSFYPFGISIGRRPRAAPYSFEALPVRIAALHVPYVTDVSHFDAARAC